mmetsp:Transcript_78970/g.169214  ORF Transcript_78970/g.169214 Transcript_78970/m.169214 type:complete len:146 (+) Transcript_78970:84-521(+)
MAPHGFNGQYAYGSGDVFSGSLNIHGKPDGKGLVYYFDSGECDAGTYTADLVAKGAGVRFNRDRDACVKLADGKPGAAISLEEGLKLAGLASVPVARNKGTMPQPVGYDVSRHRRTQAWYAYCDLKDYNIGQSCFGENPYPPVYA